MKHLALEILLLVLFGKKYIALKTMQNTFQKTMSMHWFMLKI